MKNYKIPFRKYFINVITKNLSQADEAIIFLHGFMGSASDWINIMDRIESDKPLIAIDILGFGDSDKPLEKDFYSDQSIVSQVITVINYFNFTKVSLVGYSMGGRAALAFALSDKCKIDKLLLESTSPGISDYDLRKQRVLLDENLAEKISNMEIENFIKYWYGLPLFASLKNHTPEIFNSLLETKSNNTKHAIINSLKMFGQGIMPSQWDNLSSLKSNTLLISGSLDRKYCEISKKMNEIILNTHFEIIENAGHNTHLEKPNEFVILANKFFNN